MKSAEQLKIEDIKKKLVAGEISEKDALVQIADVLDGDEEAAQDHVDNPAAPVDPVTLEPVIPVVEEPVSEPVAPAPEAPVEAPVEAPAVEAPAVEPAPAPEAPVAEPVVEQPAPSVDPPVSEPVAPAPDAPLADPAIINPTMIQVLVEIPDSKKEDLASLLVSIGGRLV